MSKAIKLDDQVYEDLDALRGKGETFGQVVEGLMGTRARLCQFLDAVEGSIKFREWQIDRLRTPAKTD